MTELIKPGASERGLTSCKKEKRLN